MRYNENCPKVVYVEAKPTWNLAWGLLWRMILLNLLIGGIAYGAFYAFMIMI